MAERVATVLFVVLVLLTLSQPALAAPPIFVGNGTPASCTETALKDALIIAETLGGATIRFKCGPDPATIALSQVATAPGFRVLLVLPNNTTIDGGGLITLDGTFTATVAFVDCAATVVLKHLSITGGNGHFEGPGGIYSCGTLTVDHSTLFGNYSGISGGAINNTGTLTVDHGTFSDNTANVNGGAINNAGTLTVDHSTFSDNTASIGGGIYHAASSTLTVRQSAFSGNTSFAGGGLFTNLNTSASLSHSTFSENSGGSGGGIFNGGTLSVEHSTLADNTARSAGGGIFTTGTLAVDHSTISQNAASVGGGIYICLEGQFFPLHPGVILCHGTSALTHTSVTENTPDDIFP